MLCSLTLFRKSHRLYDNVEKYDRAGKAIDGNTIERMRFASWIAKSTNTHIVYIIARYFPHQEWLRESASVLGYTYIASLVRY
jgi:hypothetical protein